MAGVVLQCPSVVLFSVSLENFQPRNSLPEFFFEAVVYFSFSRLCSSLSTQASKSSQYCFATSNNPEAILLLCEVALGKPYIRLEADYGAAAHCTAKGKRKDYFTTLNERHPKPSDKTD